MISPGTMHTSNILQSSRVIFRHICACTHTCMHIASINGAKGHKFEREQGEVYRRVCRKEKEGGMMSLYHNLKE